MRALLLDRDGVIITERDYDYTPENIELVPGIVDLLRTLQPDFTFFIVSNQSGVARGNYSLEDVEAVHTKLRSLLHAEGIEIADIVFCPHHPDEHCACRKPALGMWHTLAEKHKLQAKDCVMIGNRESDILFGKAIGCPTVLFNEDAIKTLPDLLVSDLRDLALLKNRTELLSPVMTVADAVRTCDTWRKEGRTLVTTNGAFDLFHAGHRFLLEQARHQGDKVVIGVNSDASVRRYKGPDRPKEPQDVRARRVAPFADAVFVFDDDDPRPWLPKIRPAIHVNAETYGKDCVEADVLQDIGAKLVLVPVKPELGSTTSILRTRT